MKKQQILVVSFIFWFLPSFAQQIGYSYQTLVSRQSPGLGRDVQEALKDQEVRVRFTLRSEHEDGPIHYQEEHDARTNAFGILNAIVGSGLSLKGSMKDLTWTKTTYYLQVELDVGEGFQLMSNEPILIPPHAEQEDQELSLDGTILSISGDPGSSIDLEPAIGNEGVAIDELQTLEAGENPGELSISEGNAVVINTDDGDPDPGNEIQSISTDGSAGDIRISDGNGIVLNVEDADSDPNNENQVVTAGNGIDVIQVDQEFTVTNTAPDQEVSLVDGGAGNVTIGGSYPDFTIDVPSLEDGDSDPTNENQVVTAGSGIEVVQVDQEFTVTNTMPDQEVSLVDGGAGNVTIGGNYPDFTIDVPSLEDGDSDPTNENQVVTAGSGIEVVQVDQEFTVTNIMPDQEISLTDGGSGNVTIGGSYPDFTIDVSSGLGGAFSTENNVTSNAPGDLAADDFVFGSSSLYDNSYPLNMMFFDKARGAFRVGQTDDQSWTESMIGNFSFATGLNVRAQESTSSAFGRGTVSKTVNGMAIGSYNTEFFGAGSPDTDDPVFIIGNGDSEVNRSDALIVRRDGNTTIHGELTIDGDNVGGAGGYRLPPQDGLANQVLTTAGDGTTSWQSPTGDSPFTLNSGVISNRNPDTEDFIFGSPDIYGLSNFPVNAVFFDKSKGAFRVGLTDHQSWAETNVGFHSFAAGFQAQASGQYAMSLGINTSAVGSASTSLGLWSTSQGLGSVAMGYDVMSGSLGEVALGLFNTYEFGSDLYELNDRLFVIGNGMDDANRSDALVILKDGSTTLYGELTIDGDNVGGEDGYRLPPQDGASGQVMITDGSGIVEWQDLADENQTVSAGTGISVNQVGQDYEVTNTAPDQTVSLSAGGSGNVTIAGTYPNFTIDVLSVADGDSDDTNENQTVSAGTGIGINQVGQDYEVTNTAPDQTVSLSAGGSGNVTIAGTYPNFTIDASGGGAFSTTGNVTSNAPGSLISDDFVFGSDQLNDDTGTNDDIRMLFDKSTGAFRAGDADGTTWDTRGANSVALGFGGYASNTNAVAIGDDPSATGLSAVAIGSGAHASGNESLALGSLSQASGYRSFAFGPTSSASASSAIAFGASSDASGLNSLALSSGTAIGSDAVSIGGYASGNQSVAIRGSSTGVSSITLGFGSSAASFGEVAAGIYNTNYIANSAGSFNSGDRIFVVGNGLDNTNRSDALIILKTGDTEINGELTIDPNNDDSGYTLPVVDGTDGQALLTDGMGNLGWGVTPAADAIFTNLSNVIAPTIGGGVASDFVIGSGLLNDDGNPAHNTRMFFDKSAGAFRAGHVEGTEWDEGSRGDYSFAAGLGTVASSTASNAMGSYNVDVASSVLEIGNGSDDTNRSNALTLLSSGHLGLGTSSPNYLLELRGDGANPQLWVQSSSTTAGDRVASFRNGANHAVFEVFADAGGRSEFEGDVGIGTTPEVPLHVSGGNNASLSGVSGYVILGNDNGTHIAMDNNEIMAKADGTTAAALLIQNEGGDTYIGSSGSDTFILGTLYVDEEFLVTGTSALADVSMDNVGVSGNLSVGGTFSNLSDSRLKQNIHPISSSLQKIQKLEGVNYNWKTIHSEDTLSLKTGFIAQEIEKVFPELVSAGKNGYKQVSYLELIPHLVEAVKELKVENDKLKSEVSELKAMNDRVDKLELLMEKLATSPLPNPSTAFDQ